MNSKVWLLFVRLPATKNHSMGERDQRPTFPGDIGAKQAKKVKL